jgi:hypothetical protein
LPDAIGKLTDVESVIMPNGTYSRDILRQYLLGRLNLQEQLDNDISEAILFNDDLALIVESVEEEIIEEYLDGKLTSDDRSAVEGYFLQSPERKDHVRFAKILDRHFGASERTLAARDRGPRPAFEHRTAEAPESLGMPSQRHRFRSYMEAAVVALLLVVGLAFVYSARKQKALLETEAARAREELRSLAQTRVTQLPSSNILTLVTERSRAAGIVPHVNLKSSTERIIVEIALPAGSSAGTFDVRLETGNNTNPLWQAKLLPLVSSTGDARLLFDLPGILKSGPYSFVVSSTSREPEYFDFEATMTE